MAGSGNAPWGTAKPNLAKLPPEIRKQLSQPIPMRTDEVHVKAVLFSTRPGQNIPNARLYISSHNDDPVKTISDKVQFEICDNTARAIVAAVVLDKKVVASVIGAMVKAYLRIGGSLSDIDANLSVVEPEPAPLLTNPLLAYLDQSEQIADVVDKE